MYKYIVRRMFKLKNKLSTMIYKLGGAKNNVEALRACRNGTGVKLELGGGESPRLRGEGFLNVDLRAIDTVDVQASAWDLNADLFPQGVDYLFSRHMLEHLTRYELPRALQNWSQVLNDGAILEIIVPDLYFHVWQLLYSNVGDKDFKHAMAGFNGWQRCEAEKNYWDVHKLTFTQDYLEQCITEHIHFSEFYFDRSLPKNIHFIGRVKK